MPLNDASKRAAITARASSGGGARGDERAREKLNGAAEETGVAQIRDARARQRRKAPLVQNAVAVAGVVVQKRGGR